VKSKLVHVLFAAAAGAAVAAALVAPTAVRATGARCRLQFGFVAQCDRPYYAVGDTAIVTLAHFNFTPADAFGYGSSGNGFGCSFSVQILDDSGAFVFTPQVGCPGVIVDRPLPSGGVLRAAPRIALVDDAGTPLPPGAYRFRVTSEFHGPSRAPGDFTAGSGNPEALIPFRIE
jgi:hypothetical protein